MKVYRPHEFAKLIGKSVPTLQRWDRTGILKAKRAPTNRRFYTHKHYLEYMAEVKNKDVKEVKNGI